MASFIGMSFVSPDPSRLLASYRGFGRGKEKSRRDRKERKGGITEVPNISRRAR